MHYDRNGRWTGHWVLLRGWNSTSQTNLWKQRSPSFTLKSAHFWNISSDFNVWKRTKSGWTILKTYIKVFKAEISHCYKHFLSYIFPTMLEQEGWWPTILCLDLLHQSIGVKIVMSLYNDWLWGRSLSLVKEMLLLIVIMNYVQIFLMPLQLLNSTDDV